MGVVLPSQGVAGEKGQNVTSNCEFSVNSHASTPSYLSTDIFSVIYKGSSQKIFKRKNLGTVTHSCTLHLSTDIFWAIERVGYKIFLEIFCFYLKCHLL